MGTSHNEPTSWKNFDDSPLSLLLRHDSWEPENAIPLICNIDTKQSEPFIAEYYYDRRFIEKESQAEPLVFWKIRLLSDLRRSCPRCWYENVDDYQEACDSWEQNHKQWLKDDVPYVSLNMTLSGQYKAQNLVKDLWGLYFSNSDHVETPMRAPHYFIIWAEKKGIEIPWLEWAVERGFLSEASKTDAAREAISNPRAVTLREKTTYLNIICGLVRLMLGNTKLGKPNSEFRDQSAIIAALEDEFPSAPGIKKRTLEGKFSDAKKSINQY